MSIACHWNQMYAHKQMQSFNWSILFIKIQGVTSNRSFQERSSQWLSTKQWSIPYHTYRISHQKLVSQIFSITPGVCPNQISLQYLIHHPILQSVAHHLRAIKLLLRNVQFFMGYHITHQMMTSNKIGLPLAITDIVLSEGILSMYIRNLRSIRCFIWQEMCKTIINLWIEILYLRIFWM